jgi:LysR family transcriptional regulator for metE and metH
MEIRHLKLVKSIVEEGSIAKASDKLHLTQSALSHQLREADYQLGTPIFSKQNKKFVLTKAGEKLYAISIEILSKLSDIEIEIKQMIYGEVGEIRISTECYTSYHWLPSIMKQFHLLYPNVDVNIVTEATHYPIQKLLANELDIAITSDPIKDERVSYTELFQDEMMMVVSENHPWAAKKYVLAEDFTTENLLIHSLPLQTVTVYQFLLAPAQLMPRKITPLPLTEASIEMVKAEMGVLSMAKWAMRPYIHKHPIKAVRIGRNGLKRKHYIVVLNNKIHPPYFNRFIEFLQTEIVISNI